MEGSGGKGSRGGRADREGTERAAFLFPYRDGLLLWLRLLDLASLGLNWSGRLLLPPVTNSRTRGTASDAFELGADDVPEEPD